MRRRGKKNIPEPANSSNNPLEFPVNYSIYLSTANDGSWEEANEKKQVTD
jgi:hypothetical protein